MRAIIKKILHILPLSLRRAVVLTREWGWGSLSAAWEKRHYPNLPQHHPSKRAHKNILIYHISGLAFAGTEKCLQLIASALAEEHRVFFMYGDKTIAAERKGAMHKNITFIPFSYHRSEAAVPHLIKKMQPHIKEVLHDHEIDLIVTASPGYAHYPWNIIADVPIILINIFGAPTLQQNVRKFISISDTVRLHAQKWTGKLPDRDLTMYAPLAQQPPSNVRELGADLRRKLGIAPTDFVFGRIGRNDDAIFDPIGIRAWQNIAVEFPDTHYVVMSPPPALVAIVQREKIPRVHFIPPSGSEEDVWAFHGAIDAMAHFRRDGETSGVAIAESLIVGNPIITHRSSIWNAHLEYLNETCALIAELDDVQGYALHMRTFVGLRDHHLETWKAMRAAARTIGTEKFSPSTYSDSIRKIATTI